MARQANAEQIRKVVGHRIRVRRTELMMVQNELGNALGLPQGVVSEWECGKRAIRVEELVNAALVLKTTVAYLVGETDRVPLSLREVEQRELFTAVQ